MRKLLALVACMPPRCCMGQLPCHRPRHRNMALLPCSYMDSMPFLAECMNLPEEARVNNAEVAIK